MYEPILVRKTFVLFRAVSKDYLFCKIYLVMPYPQNQLHLTVCSLLHWHHLNLNAVLHVFCIPAFMNIKFRFNLSSLPACKSVLIWNFFVLREQNTLYFYFAEENIDMFWQLELRRFSFFLNFMFVATTPSRQSNSSTPPGELSDRGSVVTSPESMQVNTSFH